MRELRGDGPRSSPPTQDLMMVPASGKGTASWVCSLANDVGPGFTWTGSSSLRVISCGSNGIECPSYADKYVTPSQTGSAMGLIAA